MTRTLSFFSRGHQDVVPRETSEEQLVQAIAQDPSVRELTEKSRYCKAKGDTANAKFYKSQLPCFAVAVTFSGGKKPENITGCTFLSLVDIDGLSPTEAERLFALARADPHTRLSYITVSGNGLRIIFSYTTDGETDPDTLFRTNPKQAKKLYTQVFKQGNEYYRNLLGGVEVDTHCKDCTRLSGLAYCPEVYYNPDAKPLAVSLSAEKKAASGRSRHRSTAEKAVPVVKGMLQADGVEYVPGHRNEYISRAGYLLNRYGVPLADAVEWAEEEFADYEDFPTVADIFRSCYNKEEEHGMNKLPAAHRHKFAGVDEIEVFLATQAEFRYNVITRKCELKWKGTEEFTELTDRDGNTLWSRLNKTLKPARLTDIYNVLHSEFVPEFNPFSTYFNSLPSWDGVTDHIARLAATVHLTDTAQQPLFTECFRKWLVALVPTLLVREVINHEILVLVGPQGVYKTTWFRRLLPPQLQRYFYTKTNSQRFTKDDQFTLAEFALMCFEEIESMNRSELNQLKAMITLDNINERAAYGRNKEHRAHIASFCGTGNNIQFLSDPTGTRRWLPFEVDSIDSPYDFPVDYTGVYSQAYALWRNGFRYWFEQQEIMDINRHNEYFETPRIEEELIDKYFVTSDLEDDNPSFFTIGDILEHIDGLTKQHLSPVKVGIALRKLKIPFRFFRGKRGYLLKKRPQEQVAQSRNNLGYYLKR